MGDLTTTRDFWVTTPLGDGALALERMEGHEGLGQPFVLDSCRPHARTASIRTMGDRSASKPAMSSVRSVGSTGAPAPPRTTAPRRRSCMIDSLVPFDQVVPRMNELIRAFDEAPGSATTG